MFGFLIIFSTILFASADYVDGYGEIVYAINCGGEAHIDSYGINYEKDPLQGRIGTESDYGKRLIIGRVSSEDQILYQTERYHTNTFGYDIPVSDGDFVLVLKFCEVYFNSPNQKVFDVVLNGEHVVVSELDIFDKVGRGVAYDEYIPFSVSKGKLLINDEKSDVRGGKIRVEFIKGYQDNPKINALLLVKGHLDDIPKLPPIQTEQEQVEEVKDEPEVVPKSRRPSGPKQPDPYTMDDSSLMLPVFIAIGAFIPLLFCLCKL